MQVLKNVPSLTVAFQARIVFKKLFMHNIMQNRNMMPLESQKISQSSARDLNGGVISNTKQSEKICVSIKYYL